MHKNTFCSCGNLVPNLRTAVRKSCECISTGEYISYTANKNTWVKLDYYSHKTHISSTRFFAALLAVKTEAIALFSPLSTAPTITETE